MRPQNYNVLRASTAGVAGLPNSRAVGNSFKKGALSKFGVCSESVILITKYMKINPKSSICGSFSARQYRRARKLKRDLLSDEAGARDSSSNYVGLNDNLYDVLCMY
jgi:hypothetical protein